MLKLVVSCDIFVGVKRPARCVIDAFIKSCDSYVAFSFRGIERNFSHQLEMKIETPETNNGSGKWKNYKWIFCNFASIITNSEHGKLFTGKMNEKELKRLKISTTRD